MLSELRGPHWAMQQSRVEMLTKPLTVYVNRMGGNVSKRIGDIMLPLNLLMGLIAVMKPPLDIEYSFWKEQRESKRLRTKESIGKVAAPTGPTNGNGFPSPESMQAFLAESVT
jgi:hypothetical protein